MDDIPVVIQGWSNDPYGNVLNNAGSESTLSGLDGEQVVLTGMIFPQARYLDLVTGRFVTRDLWAEDYN